MLYFISVPWSLYLLKSLNVTCQLLLSFAVNFWFDTTPSITRLKSTLSGLSLRRLSLSSHIFFAEILVVSGLCVFVKLYPSKDFVYPSIFTSSKIYLISLPFSYLGKSSKEYSHFPSELGDICLDVISVLLSPTSLYNLIVIYSGLFPSLFSASFHVFSPLIVIISGTCVFIISVPTIRSLYPSTGFSSILYLISLPFSYFGKFSNLYVHFPWESLEISLLDTSILLSFSPLINFTIMLCGLKPSWLSASTHVFSPSIVSVSGIWVFVIL